MKEAPSRLVVFIVYGSFTEPTMGKNFIVVRMPEGRVPWSKKIVPAIHRLVSPWFNRGVDKHWYVDGENDHGPGEPPLWETRTTARYEWTGRSLVMRPTNR